jgi:hypothetical protein
MNGRGINNNDNNDKMSTPHHLSSIKMFDKITCSIPSSCVNVQHSKRFFLPKLNRPSLHRISSTAAFHVFLEIGSSIDPRRTSMQPPTPTLLTTIRRLRTMTPLLGLIPKIRQIRTRSKLLPPLLPAHIPPHQHRHERHDRRPADPDHHANDYLPRTRCQAA